MQLCRYKAIKMANTAAAWRSMATICIRHKRLDVAEVCLGYMGNILGVRAIREAADVPEADARLAAAAIHLGMIDEAERLYKGCGRFDLLNTLYISQGRMDKALETSQSRDRLHMRTILFHNARHKESCGDLAGAIKAYEDAGVHCKEVPRMLWEKKDKTRLEECDGPAAPFHPSV
jgi:intraflagellar transport protein 140